jgi:Ca2+-binding RTX toxin-like protein
MDQYFAAIGDPNGWDQIGFTAEAVKASAVAYVNQALPGLSAQERAIAGEIAAYRAEAAYQGTAARYWENQASKATGTMAQEFSERAAQFRSSSDAAIKAAGDASKSLGAGTLQEIALGLKTFANQIPGIVAFAQLAEAIGSNDLYKVGETCVSLLAQIGIGALALEALLLVGAPVAVAGGLAILAGYLAGKLYEGFWKDSTADFLGIKQGDRLSDRLNDPFIAANTNTSYRTARVYAPVFNPYSPIVLDLDRDGIETTSVAAGPHFDHNSDGFAEQSGWAKGDDGLLVLDRNGNGSIDNGGELFGNNTVLGNGRKAANGFEALAELDANADGRIDASDAAYAMLKVWRDLNQDGISQAEELKTLGELGIQSIATAYTESTAVDANGNLHKQIGTFTWNDGSSSAAEDVWFKTDLFRTEATEQLPVPESIAALPDLHGSGNVRDLQQAAVLSPALTCTLQETTAAITRADLWGRLDTLLDQWAATSTFRTSREKGWEEGIGEGIQHKKLDIVYLLPWQTSSLVPGQGDINLSGAGELDPRATEEERAAAAAMKAQQEELIRIIGVLERFNGERFLEFGTNDVKRASGLPLLSLDTGGSQGGSAMVPGDIAPVTVQLYQEQYDLLQKSYRELKQSVYEGLVLQTRLKPYLDAITLNVSETGIRLNFAALTAQLDALQASDPKNALIDLIELGTYADGLLQLAGASLAERMSAWVNDPANAVAVNDAAAEIGRVAGYYYGEGATDILFGTANADQLGGGGGDDALFGRDGNDILNGAEGNDYLSGGDGIDTLYGGSGDDMLDGGAGNDTLSGDRGNDTYLFGRGSGVDTLSNIDADCAASTDVVQFGAGIIATDLELLREGNHLRIGVRNTADALIIQSWFSGDIYKVDEFRFADGTVLTAQQLMEAGCSIRGSAGNDNLYGSDVSDHITGNGGDDTLKGVAGDDVLDGGAGNDTLSGDTGSDTYLFARGGGVDTINNYASDYATTTDTVEFGAGISADDLALVKEGYHLRICLKGTADALVIQNWFSGDAYKVDRFNFADGSVLTGAQLEAKGCMLKGAEGNDSLNGSGSGDLLYGYDGADVLYGNGGNDVLEGGSGNDNLYAGEGNDALFGGGDDDYLYGGSGDDVLDGGAGNDTLSGDTGSDTYLFARGGGVDTINNYASDYATTTDTVEFGAGISADDLALVKEGYHLRICLKGTADALVIQNWFSGDINKVDEFRFADGSILTGAQLEAKGCMLSGSGGNDTLTGTGFTDVFNGGAGNDTMTGNGGNDTYVFGRGSGTDTINNYASDYATTTDTVEFGVGISAADFDLLKEGSNLRIVIRNTSDLLIIQNWFAGDPYKVDQFRFSDGTMLTAAQLEAQGYGTVSALNLSGTTADDLLVGNAANDTLNGGAGNDTLEGASGNDYLYGGSGDDVLDGGFGSDSMTGDTGNDTYRFARDGGVDSINNYASDYATTTDTVEFGAGISADDLALVKEGYHLRICLTGTADALIIQNWFSGDAYKVDRFSFADGSVLTGAQLEAKGCTLYGTATSDSLVGSGMNDILYGYDGADAMGGNGGADVLYGGSGNDTLSGHDGNDMLFGGIGDDYLYGGTGDDVLDGGSGNDTLSGEVGNDTYVLNSGYGNDVIREYDSTAGNADTVQFGFNPLDLILNKSGNNLEIQVNNSTDKVTVQNWYSGSAYHTEVFKTADGKKLLDTQVDQLIQAMASFCSTNGMTWSQAIQQKPTETQAILATYWQAA